MSKCINISHPDFKRMVEESGIHPAVLAARMGAWMDKNNTEEWPTLEHINKGNVVNYVLKAVNILMSDNAKQMFTKGAKNGWSLDEILTKLYIPKNQKQLLLDTGITDREQLALELVSKYGFSVEINTAKQTTQGIANSNRFQKGDVLYEKFGEEYTKYTSDGKVITISEKEYKAALNSTQPDTQQHSNLTVNEDFYKNNPDWEYRIQQIVTPNITPAIQNHMFGSKEDNNKIGWFRAWYNKKTGEVHVLELQSDLFQKGRDKSQLVGRDNQSENAPEVQPEYYVEDMYEVDMYRIKTPEGVYFKTYGEYSFRPKGGTNTNITREEYESKIRPANDFNEQQNKFIQLLNKDNNWVTFFIKSIIQDSAKNGYEKVLFPTGDTASKVEGHSTLEEFKKQKEDRIKQLEETKIKNTLRPVPLEINFNEPQQNLSIDQEIEQLKQELERVDREGFGALKPIYKFYENIVFNILKKQGLNPVLVTDEYGNTWNEVTIYNDRDLSTIELKRGTETALDNENAFLTLLDKLSNRFGIKYHIVSKSELAALIKARGHMPSGEVAAYIDGEIYLTENSFNSAIHEFSHPFISALRKSNPSRFDSIMKDIYQYHPEIVEEVNRLYPDKADKAEEIAVRALSLYAELQVNRQTGKRISVLERLWVALKNFINRTFGISIATPSAKINDLANSFYASRVDPVQTDVQSMRGTYIKEGVSELFENNPELAEIGNEQQYSEYLDTIFPDSKVKDIVYHTGTKGLERIEERDFNEILNRKSFGKGIYFYELLDSAKKHGASSGQIYSVLLNINNPKINTHKNYRDTAQVTKEQKDKLLKEGYDSIIGKKEQEFPYNFSDEYVVFEPEQIHILGSKQDIEGFKRFVGKTDEFKREALEVKLSTLDKLNTFLDNIGVSISIEDFGDSEVIAAANIDKGIIQITNTINDRPSAWNKLPEEAAHFWYRLLKNDSSLKLALNKAIESNKMLDEVIKKYYDKYNGDISLLKEEAIGKVIAKVIVDIENKTATKEEISFWERFKEFIRNIFSINKKEDDSFVLAATRIINSDISELLTIDEYNSLLVATLNDVPLSLINDKVEEDNLATVDDTDEYIKTILSGRYRRRTRFLPKTLEKITNANLKLLQKKKLSNEEKLLLQHQNKYITITPSLRSFEILRQKFRKQPISLHTEIKLDGIKKEELLLLNHVRGLISKETSIKSISVDEFINEVNVYLSNEYKLGFAFEKGYENYRINSTFSNPSLSSHNKISIRFNDEYIGGRSHFRLSPVAWGNITPFSEMPLSDEPTAFLLHEIQNDFYEILHDENNNNTARAEVITSLLKYPKIFTDLVMLGLSEEDLQINFLFERFKQKVTEELGLVPINGEKILEDVKQRIQALFSANQVLKSIAKRGDILFVTQDDIDKYKKLGNKKIVITSRIGERSSSSEEITEKEKFKRELIDAFLFKIISHENPNRYKLTPLEQLSIKYLLKNIRFFNANYVNNLESKNAMSKKVSYLKAELAQAYKLLKKRDTLRFLDSINIDEFKLISDNILYNVRKITSDADKINDGEKKRLENEFIKEKNYISPLLHHLIQTAILGSGGRKIYFSGYDITMLTQVQVPNKKSQTPTADLYAGPEDVTAGKAKNIGAMWLAMNKIPGIKLKYVENIPGFVKPVSGYEVDTSEYKFKKPLLFALKDSKGESKRGSEVVALKKAIKITRMSGYSDESKRNLLRRLDAYNKKNGTAHNIKFEPYGSQSYSIAEINIVNHNRNELKKAERDLAAMNYNKNARKYEEQQKKVEALKAGTQLRLFNVGEEKPSTTPARFSKFLDSAGITIAVQERLESNGFPVNAIADFCRKIISIRSGLEDTSVLTEEIAHFAVELIGDESHIVRRLMQLVVSTKTYKEVTESEEYKRQYTEDSQFRKEAIGKILRDYIVNGNVTEISPNILERLWKAILSFFGLHFTPKKVNELNELLDIITYKMDKADMAFFSHGEIKGMLFSAEPVRFQNFSKHLDNIIDSINLRLQYLKQDPTAAYNKTEEILIFSLEQAREKAEYIRGIKDFIEDANMHIVGGEVTRIDPFTREEYKIKTSGIASRILDMRIAIESGEEIPINQMAKTLRSMKKYVGAYKESINDIIVEIEGSTVKEDEEILNAIKTLATEVRTKIAFIEREYNDLMKGLLKAFFGAYISPERNSLADSLSSRIGKLDIEEALHFAKKDITFVQMVIDGMADSPNEMLQLIDIAVKDAKAKAYLKTIDDKDVISSVAERYNYKELQFVLEFNEGKYTGNILTGYNMDAFYKARTKFFEENPKPIREDYSSDSEFYAAIREYSAKVKSWFEQNTQKITNLDELKSKNYAAWVAVDERRKFFKTEEDFKAWIDKNTRTITEISESQDEDEMTFFTDFEEVSIFYNELVTPAKKYANKSFSTLSKTEQNDWEIIYRLKLQKDFSYGEHSIQHYMMPQVIATDILELAENDSFYKAWKNRQKQLLTTTTQDIEREKRVIVDPETREVTWFLPVHYTKRDVPQEQLTRDVYGMLISYANSTNHFSEMFKIINTLEATREYMRSKFKISETDAEDNVIKTTAKMIDKKASIAIRRGERTNVMHRLDEYFETVVYQHKKSEGRNIIGKLNSEKAIDYFGQYVALQGLALNLYAGISNINTATVNLLIEKAANRYFSTKNLVNAAIVYDKWMGGLISNTGKVVRNDKMTLWAEYFDVFQDYQPSGIGARRNRNMFMRQMKMSSLFIFNSAGEHFIQMRTSLALADNWKLKNKAGNEVPLYECFEVKGHKLVLKKEFEGQFSQKDYLKFRLRQNNINKDLNGIYNDVDMAMIQKWALGRMVMMFRKWMRPGFRRRWAKGYYSHELGQVKEGYYNTTIRFFKILIKNDLGHGRLAFKKYASTLSETERENLRRGLADLSFILGLFVLVFAIGAANDGDDDDGWFLNLMAFQTNRLLTETSFFANPNEWLRVVKSPAAGINQFQEISELAMMTFPLFWFIDQPWRRLKSGKYKGKTMIEKKVRRAIPPIKNIGDWFTPEDKMVFYRLN